MNDALNELDKVTPVETISDRQMGRLVSRFTGRLHVYYLDEQADNVYEFGVGDYLVHFAESRKGYFVTVVDMCRRVFRKAFVRIHQGDWVCDTDFFRTVDYLEVMLDVGAKSSDFLRRNGFRD